ncbi:MAG: hypothetical protein RJQ09_17030 [Cyclobacteriaceae bacterium]
MKRVRDKLKEKHEIIYELLEGPSMESSSPTIKKILFSRDGYILKSLSQKDDKIISEKFYEYDKEHKIIRTTSSSVNPKTSSETIFQYDRENRIIRTSSSINGRLQTIFETDYGPNEKWIEKKQIHPNGKLLFSQRRIYDSLGRNTSLFNLKQGELVRYMDYYFTDSDKYREIVTHYDFGTSSTYYDYDSLDRLTVIYTKFVSGRRNISSEYFYDQSNQLVRVRYDKSERFYKYDDKGNLIEDKLYRSGILSELEQYKYYYYE